MIDHLLGRPSTRLKRVQVLIVLAFWGAILRTGPKEGHRQIPYVRRLNAWAKRFAPWQILLFALTSVYAVRHVDALAGFGAPEPLARMYSRPFYRVTWINTALDAGFATAMPVRPKWARDLASVLFSVYYLIYANEADEKLRRFRAFCTVDFMRTTWNKTTNPYIRAFTIMHRPYLPVAQPILIPRPSTGPHGKRPIRAHLFYAKPARHLQDEDELVVDFVGGGFVCMDPRHHEERLRQTAKELQRPVLAVDYCKAPEYPFPYAVEECYDLYRTLFETGGNVIGMSGRTTFRVILAGDSAGGNLACGVVLKILEYPQPHIRSAYAAKAAGGPGGVPPALPRPIAVILNYPALNFAFTSWMKPEYLNVLRSQSEVNLQDTAPARRRSSVQMTRSRTNSLKLSEVAPSSSQGKRHVRRPTANRSYVSLAGHAELHLAERAQMAEAEPTSPRSPPTKPHATSSQGANGWIGRIEGDDVEQQGKWAEGTSSGDDDDAKQQARHRAEQQRVLAEAADKMDMELNDRQKRPGQVNTRLTMTSMAGYFQDRILSQSMLRALAILYVGPRQQPDFDNDYFLSPIVAPSKLLAEFPPVLFTCGEKDPICDDTVVMAGRIRQAKLARQAAIKRRGAPFGEQLRMSGSATLEEDDDVDDWVQMRIIEGWSHGYLQMSMLLPEAKRVISFLASWMSAAFDDYNDRMEEAAYRAQSQAERNTRPGGSHASSNASQNHPPRSSHSPLLQRAVGKGRPTQPNSQHEQGHKASSEEDDDGDEPLSFTPRSRRSPSGSPSSSSGQLPPPAFNTTRRPAQVGSRSRPSSFGDMSDNTHSGRSGSAGVLAGRERNGGSPPAVLLPPMPAASARPPRRSFDQPGDRSKTTETMLVQEQQLLARRRQDALSYMSGVNVDDDAAASQATSGSAPITQASEGSGSRGDRSGSRSTPRTASNAAARSGHDATSHLRHENEGAARSTDAGMSSSAISSDASETE